MKRTFTLMLAAAMLLCLCSPAFAEPDQGGLFEAVRAQAGTDVSGFSADRIDGGKISGEVFGQYSLCIVTYWATWSGDALRQLDFLNAIHGQRPDIGVMGILNTDSPGSEEAALAYMQQHGYDFAVFTADAVWQRVLSQTSVLPQTFYVSPSGIILEAFPGAFASAADMLAHAENWVGPQGTYTVRFYDGFGGSNSLIAQYKGLQYGAYIQAPQPPVHPGVSFLGWSAGGYGYVTHNVEVFARYSQDYLTGDADLNGSVDANDALLLLRISLGMVAPTPLHYLYGDVDGNGVINANDALFVLRMAIYN